MLRNPIGRVLLLAMLIVLVVGGWLVLPRVWSRMLAMRQNERTAPEGVSPALAEVTLDRVESLRAGHDGHVLVLGDAEVSSVVRYALPGILPPGMSDPAVAVEGGRMVLSARVATEAFPDLPAMNQVAGMLPDTVPVRIEGELARFGKESLVFRVRHMEVATIRLPDRMIPGVLEALGRRHRDGLPANAIHLPLPGGVDSIYVREDSMMLVADR